METKRILLHSNGTKPYTWGQVWRIIAAWSFTPGYVVESDDIITIGWVDGWCESDSECDGHYALQITRKLKGN